MFQISPAHKKKLGVSFHVQYFYQIVYLSVLSDEIKVCDILKIEPNTNIVK